MDPIAICYLAKEGDEKNKCLLYPESLVVFKDGRNHYFELEGSLTFTFGRRKWMLPLILGSVGLAISLLLIFRNLFNPYLTITILLVSIMAIYIGFEGSEVMIIHHRGVTNIFPIKKKSPHHLEFISFIREYIEKKLEGDGRLLIYHITSLENWRRYRHADNYLESTLETEGFIHCSKRNQVERSFLNYFEEGSLLSLLTIDPLKLNCQLKYDPSPKNSELFPHIYGPVNKSAIVSSNRFQGRDQLNALINN